MIISIAKLMKTNKQHMEIHNQKMFKLILTLQIATD